jgi:hypothetical protein
MSVGEIDVAREADGRGIAGLVLPISKVSLAIHHDRGRLGSLLQPQDRQGRALAATSLAVCRSRCAVPGPLEVPGLDDALAALRGS